MASGSRIGLISLEIPRRRAGDHLSSICTVSVESSSGASLQGTTGAEPPPMARKPNYDFEKRKKEMERKAKKDAKREDRAQRRNETANENEAPATDESAEAEPGANG
jgi:hypothetical protein